MRISDWSSDVCSSDLRPFAEAGLRRPAADVEHAEIDALPALRRFSQRPGREQLAVAVAAAAVDDFDLDVAPQAIVLQAVVADDDVAARLAQQIGRASCRERGCQYV